MQTYLEPQLSDRQGRTLWLSIFDEVKRQHLLAPALWGTLVELLLLFVLLGWFLALCWLQDSLLGLGAGYLGLSMLLSRFAFVGHDAGHGAISRKPGMNRAVGQISMTLVTGLAFDEWIERHRTHHRFCQDECRDPDMAVDFVVSLTADSHRQKGAVGTFMARYQFIHVWLLSLFFAHSQRHLSQVGALAKIGKYWLDALVLVLHFALWFALPCLLLDVPFLYALLAYLIPLFILGPHLAAIFWVNHIGMPLVRSVEAFSFFEHQSVTSRSITNPPVWNWLFGGLNFQIEHHLFPTVPSARLAAVQVIVRRHFALNAIAYHGVSWWSALQSVAAHLRAIARTGGSQVMR
jgi:fatty acid desaturase